jgi:hypothetical protein
MTRDERRETREKSKKEALVKPYVRKVEETASVLDAADGESFMFVDGLQRYPVTTIQ